MVWRVCCVLLCVSACSPPPARSLSRPEPPEPERAGVSSVVAPYFGGEPWRIDETRFVWDGLRFEVRGASTEVAADFAAPIVAATCVSDGWLMLAADGILARSDTFLGRPEVIERVDGTGTVLPSEGRVVFVRGDRLWASEGDRMEVHRAPGTILDGAFAGRRGLVVLEDGSVHETLDGASTWERLDLTQPGRPGYGRSEAVATDVVRRPDGDLVVRRSDGDFRRAGDGWEPVHLPPDHDRDDDSIDRLSLLRSAGQLPLVRLDENYLAALREVAAERPSGCVELAFGGPFTFARCRTDELIWWERWQDGGAPRRLDVSTIQPPRLSPDGRTVLFEGCDDGACAFLGEGADPHRVELGESTVHALGGGLALVEDRHDEAGEARFGLRIIELRTGRTQLISLAPNARTALAHHATLVHASVEEETASARRYVALTFERRTDASHQLVLVAGDPVLPLSIVPLPPGAVFAATLPDGPHVVFGDVEGQLHTAPRGRPFRRVPTGSEQPVAQEESAPACDALRCRLGPYAMTLAEEANVLFHQGGRLERHPLFIDENEAVSDWRAEIECPRAAIAAAPPDAILTYELGATVLRVVEGNVERWTWTMDGGRPVMATMSSEQLPESASDRLTVLRATPRYALVTRCASRRDPDSAVCSAHVLRDGRSERLPVPQFGRHERIADEHSTLLLVRVRSFMDPRRSLQIALWLDADGRVARTVARLGSTSLHLARHGGVAVAAVGLEDVRILAADGAESRVPHPPSPFNSAQCERPPAQDALLVRDGHDAVVWTRDQTLVGRGWRALNSAGGACRAGYDLLPTRPARTWPSYLRSSAEGWLVVERRGARERRVACR